jgi:N-acetylmuramoyl-L-alanine amidase
MSKKPYPRVPNKFKTERVVLHCSDTPDYVPGHKEFDRWGAADIEDWHKQRGFKKIGYHFVIRRTGVIEVGRPLTEEGAHCRAMGGNVNSVGICLIGRKFFLPEQMHSLEQLFWRFYDKPEYTGIDASEWFGHCEFDESKPNCPGMDMEGLRERFRGLVLHRGRK